MKLTVNPSFSSDNPIWRHCILIGRSFVIVAPLSFRDFPKWTFAGWQLKSQIREKKGHKTSGSQKCEVEVGGGKRKEEPGMPCGCGSRKLSNKILSFTSSVVDHPKRDEKLGRDIGFWSMILSVRWLVGWSAITGC